MMRKFVKVSDCEKDLPLVYLEQFYSESCHAQRQLVDLIVEIFTCKHCKLISKHLHSNPTLGLVHICSPVPKQLDKKKELCESH